MRILRVALHSLNYLFQPAHYVMNLPKATISSNVPVENVLCAHRKLKQKNAEVNDERVPILVVFFSL